LLSHLEDPEAGEPNKYYPFRHILPPALKTGKEELSAGNVDAFLASII
jgi:hypothetical protein